MRVGGAPLVTAATWQTETQLTQPQTAGAANIWETKFGETT